MSEQYKKFGELSRAEQLELVEHVLDGGEIEIFSDSLWHNTEVDKSEVVCFYNDYCYRKLKSELDLLKEQRDELDKKIKNLLKDHKAENIEVGDSVMNKDDFKALKGHVFKVDKGNIDPFLIDGVSYSRDLANKCFVKVHLYQ